VQDISEEDAIAEGSYLGKCPCLPPPRVPIEAAFEQHWCHVHGQEFRQLWNSINTKRGFGWDSNPWVWVVEFKVIP
jgi:hypothetical protein